MEEIFKTMRLIRIIKKILQGKDVLAIRQSEENWNKQFSGGKWDFLEKNKNISFIFDHVVKIANGRKLKILDVGCGNGALSSFGKVHEYTGIDFSKKALLSASNGCPECTFIHSDIEEIPSIDEKFDLIIFSEILYYVDFKRVLKLYQHFLKKDGFYIISIYKSWRGNIIWAYINLFFNVVSTDVVHDSVQKQTWTIKVCKNRGL